MRILVLGGDGMLGHQVFLTLSKHYEVRVTLHQPLAAYEALNLYNYDNAYAGIDVQNFESLLDVFTNFKPEAVINAIGIVKQRKLAKEAIACLRLNALLPHLLSQLCRLIGSRLVHISTDCVFSGKKGDYRESDTADADDLYGRTKLLGEVHEPHCITIRSSIIGLELSRKTSLIEWFLAQKGEINGFTKAIYTGLTTKEMSRLIEGLLMNHSELHGLWHVASQPINKYNLLTLLSSKLARTDVKILPDNSFTCDRSLNGQQFEKVTGYKAPSWDSMLDELARDIQNRKG